MKLETIIDQEQANFLVEKIIHEFNASNLKGFRMSKEKFVFLESVIFLLKNQLVVLNDESELLTIFDTAFKDYYLNLHGDNGDDWYYFFYHYYSSYKTYLTSPYITNAVIDLRNFIKFK